MTMKIGKLYEVVIPLAGWTVTDGGALESYVEMDVSDCMIFLGKASGGGTNYRHKFLFGDRIVFIDSAREDPDNWFRAP